MLNGHVFILFRYVLCRTRIPWTLPRHQTKSGPSYLANRIHGRGPHYDGHLSLILCASHGKYNNLP